MFGLFAAMGPIMKEFTAERFRDIWIPGTRMKMYSNNSDYAMVRFTPESHPEKPMIYSSFDGNLHLAMDGYILTDSAQTISGQQAQANSLIERFQRMGITAGLKSLIAGSYIMTVLDATTQEAHVIIDPIGSLAVYVTNVKNGFLVSTNPIALVRTGFVDTSLDMTACAEWALIAYALGDRYPIKGIRTLPPGTIMTIDLRSAEKNLKSFERYWDTPLAVKSPPVERTAEAFNRACVRLQIIDPLPAHLQSSGMDSRLITASWPDGYNPPCYTYGYPGAHEIRIARSVAETRGSRWTHTWQHGDEIAENLDSIFAESGIIMWPDRRFVAERIAEDNHAGVLDGLGGDGMLGGTRYGYDRYFGNNKTLKRIFAIPSDTGYSQFSMDQITEAIFDEIAQVKDFGVMGEFLTGDTLESIQKEKENILQDIRECIDNTKPASDSLALLWRNFITVNRVPHYTIQQGIMCKKYLNVYYPFTNDFEFARTAMSIHPQDAMYRRYYIRLYRNCHPRYAEIPYGNTLIPLRRPVLNHKLSAIFLSKNLSIPYLTGSHKGLQRDPNGWGIWLAESPKLRDYVRSCLSSAGLTDKLRAENFFQNIASGKIMGGGKLFHMASIAKWMTIGKSCN